MCLAVPVRDRQIMERCAEVDAGRRGAPISLMVPEAQWATMCWSTPALPSA